ncbi:MAG: hypothetical protein E7382_05570 [Clostridiales bacterium]|nr:hypothetical protein [Clostridiales bacterium]
MAYESKSIQVSASEENETIELWEAFGWELKSSQEIFNQSNRLETRGDDLYNVTTTTHYVKLVFNRNTEMENYARLVELERNFNNVRVSYTEVDDTGIPTKAKVLMGIGMVLFFQLFFDLLSCVACGTGKAIIPLGVSLIIAVIGGVLLLVSGVMIDKAQNPAKSENARRREEAERKAIREKNDIIREAKSLH